MGTHATRDEFFNALKGMEERGRLGLMAQASYLAGGRSGFESGEDLLNEAVVRVAEGARRWPKEVPIGVFMLNAMRSIVNGARGRVDLSPTRRVGLDDALASGCPQTMAALGTAASAEDEALAAEERETALAAAVWARLVLQEDELALMVLEGMLAEMTKAEVVKAHGLTDKTYRSSVGRMVTTLARLGREIKS